MKRMPVFLLTAFVVCSLTGYVVADVITDDFEDGIISCQWFVAQGAGLTVQEIGGALNIYGVAGVDFWGIDNGLYDATGYDAAGVIEASVDFRVPLLSNGGVAYLSLWGSERWISVIFQRTDVGGFYCISTWNPLDGGDYICGRPWYGDETTTFHRLKIIYDGVSNVAETYVDAELIGTLDIELGDKFRPRFLVQSPGPGTEIEVLFDNFYLNATPLPLPDQPIDATNVSLGEVRELWPTNEDAGFPAWSHDGKRIAYGTNYMDELGPKSIWVKDVGTPDQPVPVIVDDYDITFYHMPAWSPDDAWLYYPTWANQINMAEVDGLGEDIFMTDPNPSVPNILKLPEKNLAVYAAAFNLYAIEVADEGYAIGTGAWLTRIPHLRPYYPTWSSSGEQVAFSKLSGFFDWDIHVLNDVQQIISGDAEPVTSLADTRVATIATNYNLSSTPSFSFDGSHVYFTEDVTGNFTLLVDMTDPCPEDYDFDLFYAPADGSGTPKRIDDQPYSQAGLQVSPDGTMLAFFANGPEPEGDDGIPDFDVYVATLVVSALVQAGEEYTVTDGSGTSVYIPAGAMPYEDTVTIETPFPGTEPSPETLPEGASIQTARDFGPDGIVFNEGYCVTIRIYYDETQLGDIDEDTLKIWYYDEATSSWQCYCEESGVNASVVNTVENYVEACVTHFTVFAAVGFSQLPAVVDIDPDAINLKSKGKYITCYIELPPGFDPADIVISSLLLNGEVPAEQSPSAIGDYDSDGIPDLMVKFDRPTVQEAVSPGASVAISVTGVMTNGTSFEGTDYIRVMDKGSSHTNEADPSSVVY